MAELSVPKEVLQSGVYGPIFAGIFALGAVLTILTQLRALTSESKDRVKDLDERSKAVAFWQTWYQAQLAVSSSQELARARDLARERLNELSQPRKPPVPLERTLSVLRGILLLRPARGLHVWAFRAIYYLALLALVVVTDLTIADAQEGRASLWLVIMVVAGLVILASLARTVAVLANQEPRVEEDPE
jgi:hypothetical protein